MRSSIVVRVSEENELGCVRELGLIRIYEDSDPGNFATAMFSDSSLDGERYSTRVLGGVTGFREGSVWQLVQRALGGLFGPPRKTSAQIAAEVFERKRGGK